MRLYTYWRSSCSYRVRIALGLKGLGWDSAPIHLVQGEQMTEDYGAVNPSRRVPALELPGGTRLTQSLAIIDWLEATYPEPPLVPAEPLARARVIAAAHAIAMDVQPVTNSGVLAHLRADYGIDEDGIAGWMRHWMERGFMAFQELIDADTPYCFGAAPGLADLCLVPQMYNAERWDCDLSPVPRLTEIAARCRALPAFAAAAPEAQPDAV